MVYVRDQQLEEKLQLLKHRERLQHLLLQQCQPGQRADGDTKPPPGQRPPSPWLGIACKEERFFLEDAADGKEEKELWLGRERCELRAKVKEARDEDADAPLDLSEPGRGRDTDWHGRRDSPGDSPAVAAARGGHRAQRDRLRCPYHWPGVAKEEEEEEEDAAVVSAARWHRLQLLPHRRVSSTAAGIIVPSINTLWEDGFDTRDASLLSPGSHSPSPLQCPQGWQCLYPSHRLLQELLSSQQAPHSDACPCGCHRHQVRAGDNPVLPGGSSVCAPCLYPCVTAHAFTGISDKQLHTQRPRGSS